MTVIHCIQNLLTNMKKKYIKGKVRDQMVIPVLGVSGSNLMTLILVLFLINLF